MCVQWPQSSSNLRVWAIHWFSSLEKCGIHFINIPRLLLPPLPPESVPLHGDSLQMPSLMRLGVCLCVCVCVYERECHSFCMCDEPWLLSMVYCCSCSSASSLSSSMPWCV